MTEQEHKPLQADEWLKSFAMAAGTRLTEDEITHLMYIAGWSRGMASRLADTENTRDALAGMLDRLANMIKGQPEPGEAWGFGDLPEVLAALLADKKGQPYAN